MLLWTVGAPGRIFGALLGLATVAVAALAVVEPLPVRAGQRLPRPVRGHRPAPATRPLQGLSALSQRRAGSGSGSARAGRSGCSLPEAHNDFIFAVIAEELGLVGCLVVLLLFAVLAYAGLRIARRVEPTRSAGWSRRR